MQLSALCSRRNPLRRDEAVHRYVGTFGLGTPELVLRDGNNCDLARPESLSEGPGRTLIRSRPEHSTVSTQHSELRPFGSDGRGLQVHLGHTHSEKTKCHVNSGQRFQGDGRII